MNTVTLNEQQLNSLAMALELAEQTASTRIQNSVEGEIRHNVAVNQRKAFIELAGLVCREMDILYADKI
jgi:hypothetical protein